MLEKPKRPKQLSNQDRQIPATIQDLINKYDLENIDIYKFLDYLVDNVNENKSEVVDNLESESKTESLSANQGKILNEKMSGTVLYDNLAGENEMITLSDSVVNYRELRIDYKATTVNYGTKESIRVFIVDGDNISLSSIFPHSDTLQLIASARYLISGNTITKQHEIRSRIDTSGVITSDGNMSTILITQVIGYK